jgi:predicted ferric reductase
MLCVLIPRHPIAKYEVGSYIFVSFVGIAFFEWHPFTLSSGPNDELLEIHIKGLGDHTKQLIERAKARGADARFWVRVDGPYGHVTFDHRRFAYVLLVGAGVGVTPCIAALKDIYRVRMSESMRHGKPQQQRGAGGASGVVVQESAAPRVVHRRAQVVHREGARRRSRAIRS